MAEQLRYQSDVDATPEELWRWITSEEGIRAEMRPWLRMRFPAGVRSLADLEIEPDRVVFRSWLLLFGALPVGVSWLSFSEWRPGSGFTEQSVMTGVRHWQHRRHIEPLDQGARLVDELTFEPLLLPSLTRRIASAFFRHRHRQLARAFPELRGK